MKYELLLSSQFKRDVKRAQKRGLDMRLLQEIVESLLKDVPLTKRHCDHPLSGNRKDVRECHIQPDWLLIYRKDKETVTLALLETGSHADLLGM